MQSHAASAACSALILTALSLWVGSATAEAMPIIAVALQSTNQMPPPSPDSYVRTLVNKITTEVSRKEKWDDAQRLNQWVVHHPNDVSADDIDALASLLSNESDAVRGWIAGALGILGDKAIKAVPALQRALQERPCENQPMTSANAIRLALSRIGAQPINAPCTDPFGT